MSKQINKKKREARAEKEENALEHIEGALTNSEQFIEKNQKKIVNIILILIVIVGAYFLYHSYVEIPKEKEANTQIVGAQNYFERDSFNLALNGDGNLLGFKDISSKYSSTDAGNLANYYAGICCLNMNQYKEAISYLKKFSSDDLLLSTFAYSNTGDAYMQLKDYKNAASYYNKASSNNVNNFTTPIVLMKNALALEKLNDYKGALKIYNKIDVDYPDTMEARNIEKYITRAKLNIK
ncbi:MAG: tetratricopeptide repeat protein [Bacilli bacterium]